MNFKVGDRVMYQRREYTIKSINNTMDHDNVKLNDRNNPVCAHSLDLVCAYSLESVLPKYTAFISSLEKIEEK